MGTRPTHTLTLWNPETKASTVAGVAWMNPENNRVSIKLNPGVKVEYWDLERGGLKLTLFPVDRPAAEYVREEKKNSGRNPADGEIPF